MSITLRFIIQQATEPKPIARLRKGHCHLNEYLNRFKIIETAERECGAERETVEQKERLWSRKRDCGAFPAEVRAI
jgi:hypothetical protein